VSPGHTRPHQEEERNAGAHPKRKRIRRSGKTAKFKPATSREFRNVAETYRSFSELVGLEDLNAFYCALEGARRGRH